MEEFVKKCEEIAQKNFGYPELREAQRTVLAALFDGKFILAMLPTGAGKTLLYALPSLVFSEPVVVVSPLISLMRDQAQRMEKSGIPCALFTSEQSEEERLVAWQNLRTKKAKIIFASPERFVLNSFLNALIKVTPSMIVVDEAHCIVTWGHNFRPEYAEIGKTIAKIAPPRILALTATASKPSRKDIIQKVFPRDTRTFEIVHAPLAENIVVESHRVFSKVEKLLALVQMLKKTTSRKTIVYFSSRSLCEEVAKSLKNEKINTIIYHAGLTKQERLNSEKYIYHTRERLVICATTAFGMGVDVADVEFVICFGFASHIEELLQMFGRAGRNGKNARGLLLWSGDDLIKKEFQFKEAFPTGSQLITLCSALVSFFPKNNSEKKYLQGRTLLNGIKGNSLNAKQRTLESILTACRICKIVELVTPNFDYLQVSLNKETTLISLLENLPPGPTKRRHVLEALSKNAGAEWGLLKGGENIFSLSSLEEGNSDFIKSFHAVLSHYQEKKQLDFKIIKASDGTEIEFILKHSFSFFKAQLPLFTKAREEFYQSFKEVEAFAKATDCRLKRSLSFFSSSAAKKRMTCGQCDLCLKSQHRELEHAL